jgi:hypothetical protein
MKGICGRGVCGPLGRCTLVSLSGLRAGAPTAAGVIRAERPARMPPFLCGQGSPDRSVWRWAWLGGWPADHFDEAEDDQQQDGDQHHDRGGRLAPEDEDQRGQRHGPDP